MDEIKIIDVKASIFSDNDREANELRNVLKKSGTFLMNLMSSPGSGKTTTLKALVPYLKGMRWSVMEADIDSEVDTRTMRQAGVETIQLHTGGMCHLDAEMTRQGLKEVGSDKYELVILENVGNLVCPAEFDTGAVKNVVILSVPEGDDKPLKYPLMFEKCDLLIVNKIDVMSCFDFDFDQLKENAALRNPEIEVIPVSAKTGEGMDRVAEWLFNEMKEWGKGE